MDRTDRAYRPSSLLGLDLLHISRKAVSLSIEVLGSPYHTPSRIINASLFPSCYQGLPNVVMPIRYPPFSCALISRNDILLLLLAKYMPCPVRVDLSLAVSIACVALNLQSAAIRVHNLNVLSSLS
jgi:hypothetical protein